jgi:hypothetical protein
LIFLKGTPLRLILLNACSPSSVTTSWSTSIGSLALSSGHEAASSILGGLDLQELILLRSISCPRVTSFLDKLVHHVQIVGSVRLGDNLLLLSLVREGVASRGWVRVGLAEGKWRLLLLAKALARERPSGLGLVLHFRRLVLEAESSS